MHYENSINYVFETKEYDEEVIENNKDKIIVIFLDMQNYLPRITEVTF